MPKYIIQLNDSGENSFFITVNISAAKWAVPNGNAGTWRSLDKGFIRHNGGSMWWQEAAGTATAKHLLLLDAKGYWGIRLHEFKDFFGVNEKNSGIVLQSWVLNYEVGRISWLLME